MRLSVLPGMEVCTAEEVHILAIFGAVRPVLKLQKLVYENLDPGENAPELFGDQIVANELDEVEGYNRRLLISATRLRLERIIDEIHDLGGLAIASHVDRPSFSIIGQLGFIPPGLKIDGLELSPHLLREKATAQLPGVAGFPLLRSSDAHVLGDIGAAASIYLLAEPTLEEIGRALRAAAGRRVLGEG
jgi:predicted metal-dependent phosphoesterase TrpH